MVGMRLLVEVEAQVLIVFAVASAFINSTNSNLEQAVFITSQLIKGRDRLGIIFKPRVQYYKDKF